MSTITARIPDELNNALTEVAKQTERSRSYIILKAIQNYVLELQEDIEDIRDADEAIARIEAGGKIYSWEEVQRECGLLED
jgi:predicted transcriptional regulator